MVKIRRSLRLPYIGRRKFISSTLWASAALLVTSVSAARLLFAQNEKSACDYFNGQWPGDLPKRLAIRKRRLHHLAFHTVRNNWFYLDEKQRDEIADRGWAPPRPSIAQAKWDSNRHWRTGNTFWNTENGSGEDFLFMHRSMITIVNGWLHDLDLKPLVAWSNQDTIPPPGGGCPDENVPQWEHGDEVLNRRLKHVKSDAYYWSNQVYENARFRNPGELRNMTLGQLGALVEGTVHNNMHLRFATKPWDPDAASHEGDGRPSWDLDEKWDDLQYNTLLDEHSSHVSEYFWRLHMWVDNRISDWIEANNHPTDVDYGFEWPKVDSPKVIVTDPWHGQADFAQDEAPGTQVKDMEDVLRIIDPPPDEGVLPEAVPLISRRVINLRNLP